MNRDTKYNDIHTRTDRNQTLHWHGSQQKSAHCVLHKLFTDLNSTEDKCTHQLHIANKQHFKKTFKLIKQNQKSIENPKIYPNFAQRLIQDAYARHEHKSFW